MLSNLFDLFITLIRHLRHRHQQIPFFEVDQFDALGRAADDPDTGDALTFSLDSAPAGMTIDSVTGLVLWTPANQIGDHFVAVRVNDAQGLLDTQSFLVTAVLPDVNDPPTITSTPIASVNSWDKQAKHEPKNIKFHNILFNNMLQFL